MAGDMSRALGDNNVVKRLYDIDFLVENTAVSAHKVIYLKLPWSGVVIRANCFFRQ